MTSTITSSGVRQTPAFTVPSTQNTAPVLEYRCLYTHDLRRKQKRWQDGLLRFHTFNKRIMVYDVSRNYIGDMHWREDEILQDGDEFELDRGVLIQVGEAIGSMEQDLTGLFEKRKKVPEVAVHEEAPHQPVAVPMSGPIAAQPSQLRPKSLNALLGTPKGRIGRAAVPTKSPHELRTESENSSWDHGRPAKRQRIELQVERRAEPNKMPPPRVPPNSRVPDEGVNTIVVEAVVDQRCEGRVPTTVQRSALSSARSAASKPPISLSTWSKNNTDEGSKRAIEPMPKERSSGSGSSGLTAQQQRKRKPDRNAQVSPKAKKAAKRLDHEPETCHARTSTITKPIEIASDEDSTSTDQQPIQRSKLQMASRKPRKKLLYRDLLPQDSSAIGRSSGDASILDRSSRDRSTRSRPEKRKGDHMAEFHKEEQERLKARLNRHHTKECQLNNERGEICGDTPEDLFLSQEDIDTISANNPRTKEKQSKEKAPNSSVTWSCRRHTESVPSSTCRSLSPEFLPEVIPRSPSAVHSSAMTLAKMDQILFSRPQPRTSESVEENDVLPEVLPQELSSPPALNEPLDAVPTPSPPKDRPHSFPAFQMQAHVPSSQGIPQEAISTLSRPNPDSLSAFAKAVQPKAQGRKLRSSNIRPPGSHLPSIQPTPGNTVSAPSSPRHHPVSAPGLQTRPDVHPTKFPSPEAPIADVIIPIPNAKHDSLSAFSKNVAPKPPTALEPVPRHKPNKQPAFTKVTPIIPIPKLPDETVEVLSSQPPSSPPPEAPIVAPHPPKRKPDSLPAFTKVIPTKPRSPLKKSISDTSAMRPPSALPVSGGEEKASLDNLGGKDESASLWSKEAWDLFGCGRDGVECTYEEFKRKEGLV